MHHHYVSPCRSHRCLLAFLAFLLPLGWVARAHEVRHFPLGDEGLVPIVIADDHMSLTATALEFPETLVGGERGLRLEIANISASTQGVTLGMTDGPFSLIPVETSFSIDPGKQRALDVVFAPKNAGEFKTSLEVTATDPLGYSQDLSVSVLAVALESYLRIASDEGTGISAASFGEVAVGVDAAKSFTVENRSSGEVLVELAWTGSALVLIDGATEFSLAAGEVRLFALRFEPASTADAFNGNLLATADPVDEPPQGVVVDVDALVIPTYLSGVPEELDFGEVEIGDSELRSFIVINEATEDVDVVVQLRPLENVWLGAGDDEFEIPAGFSHQVDIAYTPHPLEDPPLTVAFVEVTNDDGYLQGFRIQLHGERAVPSAQLVLEEFFIPLEVSAVDHGQIVIDTPSLHRYILRNIGSVATENGRISLEGQNGNCGGPQGALCILQLTGEDWQPLEFYSLGQAASPTSAITVGFQWTPSDPMVLSPPSNIVEFLGGSDPLSIPQIGEAIDGSGPVIQLLGDSGVVLTDILLDSADRVDVETLVRNFKLKNMGETQTIGEALGLDPATSCIPDGLFNKCIYSAAGGQPLAQYTLAAGEEKDAVLYWIYSPAEDQDLDHPLLFTNSIDDPTQSAPLTIHTKAEGETPDGGGTPSGPNGFAHPDEFGGARGLINENAFFSDLDIDAVNKMSGNLVVSLPVGTPWQVGPGFRYGISASFNSNAWMVRQGGEFGIPNALVTQGLITLPFPTNAGLGWNLNLGGELYLGAGQLDGAPLGWPDENDLSFFDWIYIDGSGGKHPFSNGNPTMFALDDSNIRLREGAGFSAVFIDLPNGLTQEFGSYTGDGCPLSGAVPKQCWRLEEIRDPFGNWVQFGYPADSGNPGFSLTKITDVHGREIKVKYKQLDTHSERFQTWATKHVKAIEFPSTEDHAEAATWNFQLREATITRACPLDEDRFTNSADWDITVFLLDQINLPGANGDYSFDYDDLNTSDSCRQTAGELESITSPLGGRIEYDFTGVDLPIPCPADYRNEPPDVSRVRGVFSRRVLAPSSSGDTLVSQNDFRYRLVDRQRDPLHCSRANTMETHISHRVPFGNDQDKHYRHEVFFHNVTKSVDNNTVLPPGDWRHRDFGLPIAKSRSIPSEFSSEPPLFLSSVVLDCDIPGHFRYNEADYLPGDQEPGIPDHCTVHREEYHQYNYQTVPLVCTDNHVRFASCSFRARVLSGRLQRFFKGGEVLQFREEKHTDFDGFGSFRKTTVMSNVGGGDLTTWENTDTYVWNNAATPSQWQPEVILNSTTFDPLPDRTFVGPWILGLYKYQQSNPDGKVRYTEFDFNTKGFLKCNRTFATLGNSDGTPPAPESWDVTVEYTPLGIGWPSHESWAGGNGGSAGCGQTPQYRIHHQYSMGQLTKSTYLTGAGGPAAPPSVDLQLDSSTGLVEQTCDNSVVPRLCREIDYDLLGRPVFDGSSDSPGRGLNRTYQYSLQNPGGVVTVTTKDAADNQLLDKIELTLDSLGREIQVNRLISEERSDPRVEDAAADWIVQRKGYQRGKLDYVTGVYDKSLWDQMSLASKRDTRYQFVTYDIHGRVLRFVNPKGEFVHMAYHGGAIERDVVWRPFGGSTDDLVRTDSRRDHLGRPVKVEEGNINGSVLNPYRVTNFSYVGGLQTISRGGQRRERKLDGRGFVLWEHVPEKKDAGESESAARVKYTYNSRGKVKTVEDNGTTLAYLYDRAGRLKQIRLGSPEGRLLEDRTYLDSPAPAPEVGLRGGRLDHATRFNYFTGEETDGYTDVFLDFDNDEEVLVMEVHDNFQYDDRGNVSAKTTRLDVVRLDQNYLPIVGGRDVLTEMNAEWTYDGASRPVEIRFPHCTGAGAYCGLINGANLADLHLEFDYEVGELTGARMSDDAWDTANPTYHPLIDYTYHPSGTVRRRTRYGLATETSQGYDEMLEYVYQEGEDGSVTSPSLTLPRVGSISTWRVLGASNPFQLWASGSYGYDGRGQINSIGSTSYQYDRLSRLAGTNSGGDEYSYDIFDNLLMGDGLPFSVSTSSNRLVTADGHTAVHDSRGHLTDLGPHHARYDPFGRQSAFWWNYDRIDPTNTGAGDLTPWDHQAIYVYSALGERILSLARLPEDQGNTNIVTGVVDPDPKDVDLTGRLDGDFSETLIKFYGPGGPMREFRVTDEVTASTSSWFRIGVRSFIGRDATLYEGSDGSGDQEYRLRHLTTDHLGSVRHAWVFNSDHEVPFFNEDDAYTPWGRWQGDDPIGESFGFAGHQGDRNQALYDVPRDGKIYTMNMKARTYLPEFGRFLSVDPARDSGAWSLYAYAGNDPVNGVDPSGLVNEKAQAETDPGPDITSSRRAADALPACYRDRQCREELLRHGKGAANYYSTDIMFSTGLGDEGGSAVIRRKDSIGVGVEVMGVGLNAALSGSLTEHVETPVGTKVTTSDNASITVGFVGLEFEKETIDYTRASLNYTVTETTRHYSMTFNLGPFQMDLGSGDITTEFNAELNLPGFSVGGFKLQLISPRALISDPLTDALSGGSN